MVGSKGLFDKWFRRTKAEARNAFDPRRVARARARLDVGEFAGALSDCDAVLATQPTHYDTLLVKGSALFHLGRVTEALQIYDVLADLKSDPYLHVWRALCLQTLGRLPEGRIAADAALRLDPYRVDALQIRAQLLWAMGDKQAAMIDLESALLGARDKKPLLRLKAEAPVRFAALARLGAV